MHGLVLRYANLDVFSGHYRKVKAIFGFTDSALITVAFIGAYETRIRLPFHFFFEIPFPVAPFFWRCLSVTV
jgi:hypothetical protein